MVWLIAFDRVMSNLSRPMTRWLFPANGNHCTDPLVSIVSKETDSRYVIGAIDKVTGLIQYPLNHRILDGNHFPLASFRLAWTVGNQHGYRPAAIIKAWGRSYLEDFGSPAGMPISSLSKPVYGLARHFGVPEHVATRLVTMNGERLVSGTLSTVSSAIPLIVTWQSPDPAHFSRTLGNVAVIALANGLNPFSAAVGLSFAAASKRGALKAEALRIGGFVGLASSFTFMVAAPLGPFAIVPAAIVGNYFDKHLQSDQPLSLQLTGLVDGWRNSCQVAAAFARGFFDHLFSKTASGQSLRSADLPPESTVSSRARADC